MQISSANFRNTHKIYGQAPIIHVDDYPMTTKGGGVLAVGGGGDYVDLNRNGQLDWAQGSMDWLDRKTVSTAEPQLSVPVAALRDAAGQIGTQVLTAENLANVQIRDIQMSWGGFSGPQVTANNQRSLASLWPVTGDGISYAIDLSGPQAEFLIYGPR